MFDEEGCVVLLVNSMMVVMNCLFVDNRKDAPTTCGPSVFDKLHVGMTPMMYLAKCLVGVFNVLCHPEQDWLSRYFPYVRRRRCR